VSEIEAQGDGRTHMVPEPEALRHRLIGIIRRMGIPVRDLARWLG
jgi:hypothetical protein